MRWEGWPPCRSPGWSGCWARPPGRAEECAGPRRRPEAWSRSLRVLALGGQWAYYLFDVLNFLIHQLFVSTKFIVIKLIDGVPEAL